MSVWRGRQFRWDAPHLVCPKFLIHHLWDVRRVRSRNLSHHWAPQRRPLLKIKPEQEIRNSKSETNPKERNPNRKTRQPRAVLSLGAFSNFEFVSDFGFRASDLSSRKWRLARCWNSARKSDFVFAQTLRRSPCLALLSCRVRFRPIQRPEDRIDDQSSE